MSLFCCLLDQGHRQHGIAGCVDVVLLHPGDRLQIPLLHGIEDLDVLKSRGLELAALQNKGQGVDPGAVVQVMQAGFELMGRIVRPALVVVASKSGAAPAGGYGQASAEAGGAVDTKA